MTRDDIIRMAREAGLCSWAIVPANESEKLERFAALVAAAERDRFVSILGKLSTDDNLAKNSSFCPVCNRQEMVKAKFDEESG